MFIFDVNPMIIMLTNQIAEWPEYLCHTRPSAKHRKWNKISGNERKTAWYCNDVFDWSVLNLVIQVTPVADTSLDNTLNRPAPHKDQCLLAVNPLPPDPINKDDIIVYDFTIDFNKALFLNFTWALPEATYGRVTMYQVRVLHMPVSAHGATTSSNIITEQVFISVS